MPVFANRERLEEHELRVLAPYAAKSRQSRGRQYPEPEHPYRTAFQRDRDRIVHTTAFRRLEYKTQVFVNHEGDHYRTRLTHTIETAQIARTIARALLLNEDLAEAIALAHDLGHTPFGHSGEGALHDILREHGGFNHNAQSLRQVVELEQRGLAYPGLNLTWEVREGIVKHTTAYDVSDARDYEPERHATLEAQIVNAADEIAYNAHDLDDGLRAALIQPRDLAGIQVWEEACTCAGVRPGALSEMDRRVAVRELINAEVTDVIGTASAGLAAHGISTLEQARQHPSNLVAFSPEMSEKNRQLRDFLFTHLYRHYRVMRMDVKARRLIRQLFDAYMRDPIVLPDAVQARLPHDPQRVICDYIAGMTDRFALEEYRKLFDPEERT